MAGRRLRAKLGTWAAGIVPDPEHDDVAPAGASGTTTPLLVIALKPPTEREVRLDERAAEEWAHEWGTLPAIDGVEVGWETRAWRSIGRQRVPVRLRLHDADAVARFVGGSSGAQWRRVRDRVRLITERLGSSEALGPVIRRHAGELGTFDDARVEQVVEVAAWAVAHPVTGFRPRQVPVRGVDSKWLGSHRRIVADLVGATTGSPDLGLVDADPLVRLRALDEGLALGGLQDLAAPAAQLAEVPLTPTAVFVMENLESILAMPSWPGAVAIHGSGYAVDVVARLPWVRAVPVLYWGDLDSNGFAILHRLRMNHPDVTSLLMDEPTLLAHRDLWVPEPTPARGVVDTLTDGENRALLALRREGDVRLEQERIPWNHALCELRQAWEQVHARRVRPGFCRPHTR